MGRKGRSTPHRRRVRRAQSLPGLEEFAAAPEPTLQAQRPRPLGRYAARPDRSSPTVRRSPPHARSIRSVESPATNGPLHSTAQYPPRRAAALQPYIAASTATFATAHSAPGAPRSAHRVVAALRLGDSGSSATTATPAARSARNSAAQKHHPTAAAAAGHRRQQIMRPFCAVVRPAYRSAPCPQPVVRRHRIEPA